MAQQDAARVLQGKRRTARRRPYRRGRQPLQPLPHLHVQQGNHARQERARADRQCRKANQQRTGPRLHHQLELRHRRNLDTPRPQLQRRLFRRPPQPERNRHGKGQSDVRQPLQLVPAVLRQPALDGRPRLCGRIRPVPLRAGLLHRQRPPEVGVAGSNLLLHRFGMG